MQTACSRLVRKTASMIAASRCVQKNNSCGLMWFNGKPSASKNAFNATPAETE
jgi:hypothetical protein